MYPHRSQLHEQVTHKISDILKEGKPLVVIQHNFKALVINNGEIPRIAKVIISCIHLLEVHHYFFFWWTQSRAVDVAPGAARAHLEDPGAQQVRVGAVGRGVGARAAEPGQQQQQEGGEQRAGPGTHAGALARGRPTGESWGKAGERSGTGSRTAAAALK